MVRELRVEAIKPKHNTSSFPEAAMNLREKTGSLQPQHPVRHLSVCKLSVAEPGGKRENHRRDRAGEERWIFIA